MHPNFAERLFTAMLRQPAQEVVRWPATQAGGAALSVSGAGLLARVAAWQRALLASGTLPVGTPVLLAHPSSPELVAALLALMGLGAVPVLPPAGATPRQLLALVRAEGIERAVTTPRLQRRLGWLARLLGCRCVALAAPAAASYEAAPAAVHPTLRHVSPAQPALVSHSSGSVSGRPAAVRRSHQVLQAQHEALRTQFSPWAGQRDFPLFPNILLHNLAVGVLSLLPDLPGGRLAAFDPARIAAQLAAERVQTLTGNVYYFSTLVAHLAERPAVFPLVRALGIGGSPVPEHLLAALGRYFPQATCYVIYGSSEAEPIAVRAAAAADCLAPGRGYCVGFPAAGLALELRHSAPIWQPADLVCGIGSGNAGSTARPAQQPFMAGEIVVRGPHVAQPAGTAARAEGLATGDFGYFDAAGRLWLVGRRGAATLVRGVGHYQVEHVLRHTPGVVQAAALPTADAAGFKVFIVGTASLEAVRAAVETAFRPGLVSQVVRRPRLPVDQRHHSKIRYDLLR